MTISIGTKVAHRDGKPFVGSDSTTAIVEAFRGGWVTLRGLRGSYRKGVLVEVKEETPAGLQSFDFADVSLRAVTIAGEPWFVLADVNRSLYGKTAGLNWVTRRLDADELTKCDRTTLGMAPGHRMVLVSESGLYKLITRSDKPEARKFQDWVTRDVLPAIRKTGGYILNEDARDTAHADDREAMPLPEGFAQVFEMLTKVLEQNTRLLDVLMQERQGREQATKAAPIKSMISAAEAVDRFGLPAITDTGKLGYALTVFCKDNDIEYRKRKNSMSVNRYPISAFEAYLGPQPA